MTIACIGLEVKVKGQANAVGPTSIEGSFFLVDILQPQMRVLLPAMWLLLVFGRSKSESNRTFV